MYAQLFGRCQSDLLVNKTKHILNFCQKKKKLLHNVSNMSGNFSYVCQWLLINVPKFLCALLPPASEGWGKYCFHRCLSVHTEGGTPVPGSFLGLWSQVLSGATLVLAGGYPSPGRGDTPVLAEGFLSPGQGWPQWVELHFWIFKHCGEILLSYVRSFPSGTRT